MYVGSHGIVLLFNYLSSCEVEILSMKFIGQNVIETYFKF
jgi:hypothetical protein